MTISLPIFYLFARVFVCDHRYVISCKEKTS
jgi:hypothetical protein